MQNLSRRYALISGAMALSLGCRAHAQEDAGPPFADVSGALPDLQFAMSLASTGRQVTARDFALHPVILYFGFTRCTDTCPLTMHNAAELIRRMGPSGQKLRVLFVTIDPEYDTLSRLKTYMAYFGPPPVMDGLRGTPAQLAALAKRYGVQYSAVRSADTPDPVADITHSIAVYGFGPTGRAKYLLGSLADPKPDLATLARLMTPLTAA